jgi:hypothetical protein
MISEGCAAAPEAATACRLAPAGCSACAAGTADWRAANISLADVDGAASAANAFVAQARTIAASAIPREQAVTADILISL